MNKVLHLFGEGTIGFDNRDRYTTRYAYDKNGNMLTLIRKGLQDDGSYGPIDNVSMQYEDNQLVRATDDVDGPFYAGAWHFRDGADAVEEYEYDENGNMTQDLNNGIENIEYNVLNLPKLITFANGGTIRYTYSATGEKLKAEYTMTSDSIIKTTDYYANVIYQDGNYPKDEEKFKAISNMEIEAYKMQYSYDKSFPGTVSSLKDIGVHSVGEIMNGGSHVYDAIYQYSIFLKERNKIKNQ